MRVKVNPAYLPLINNRDKALFILGGAGSGKSYFTAQKILIRVLTETPHRFVVLRKVGATLKDSVFALFRDLIIEWDIYSEFEINKSDKTFTHVPTGNQILCKGLDEPEKIKSIQGATGVWMEELTEFEYDDFTQLLLRIRGGHSNYIQYIGTFNPISEYHWIKKYVENNPDKVTLIKTTYRDNVYLTEQDIQQLEDLKETNPLYYQIYCLGEWGVEDKSGKFAYEFNRDKHVRRGVPYNSDETTYLSFDFNINPIGCVVAQLYDDAVRIVEVIKLNTSNIYELCDVIKVRYPDALFIVTGDATGRASSAMVKDNLNYYRVIQDQLDLTDSQFVLPSVNPPTEQNRVLVNAVLRNGVVEIDEEKAAALIFDLTYAEVDERNKLKKDNRQDEKQQLEALDGFRYLLNAFMRDYLTNPKQLIQKSSDNDLIEYE